MRIKTGISRHQIVFILFVFSLLASNGVFAQGNLLITPRRVILDPDRRTAEINLANTGKDTTRYVISLVEMEMNENGSIAMFNGSDSGRKHSSPYLRYYPHEVALAPNEAQTVKIQYSRSVELDPGEYRSHLYFRAKSIEAPLGDTSAKRAKSIAVSLKPTFGLCIPVIIRIGDNQTAVKLSDASLNVKEKEPKLSLVFQREGNMSVYGDVTVNHIAPNGVVTQAGQAKGIAIYTSVNKRLFTMSLSEEEKINYSSGSLQIAFTENGSDNAKLAETTLQLN